MLRAFGLTLILLTVSPAMALANTLVATSPVAGSTLSSAPSAVTISAESSLMELGHQISVTDPSGSRVDDGTLTIADTDAIVGMKTISKAGIYTVTYVLLSDNDIPLEGSFTFNYSPPMQATPETVAPSSPAETIPAEPNGSDFGTNLFVVGLLILSLGVLIALALYARKIFNER
jgi:methionine-rich copper-binding protein CopC